MARPRPARLVVGILGRAVGLHGEVEVRVLSDDVARFEPGSALTDEDGRELTVRSRRRHKDRTIVAFHGTDDRTAADALRGRTLYVGADRVRRLEPGEFWDHDLVGCRIDTRDGRRAGVVVDVLHSGANDILVVETQSGERLVPLVADLVDVRVEARTIVVDAIPGLLDED